MKKIKRFNKPTAPRVVVWKDQAKLDEVRARQPATECVVFPNRQRHRILIAYRTPDRAQFPGIGATD